MGPEKSEFVPSYPTKFASSYELAKLPWFELQEGRLIRDPSLGLAIDIHTHLALSFIRKDTVDLDASPRPAEHYLPLDAPLDLDVNANRNFKEAHMGAMKRDLGFAGLLGLPGMRDTHTAPNLVQEMKELGIVTSVLLPIELPKISCKAESYLKVAERHAPLVGFGSVHPFERGFAQRLARQKEAGARGVKIHPAVQMLPPDHPRCLEVYRECGALGLPVFWHCGPVDIEGRWGRYCSQVKHYWNAVRLFPETTFVLGHTGALQMEMAMELVHTYPNVYCEIASQGVSSVARLVEGVPIDRLMFGTDWPFYHQGAGLAKVLMATEGKPTERALVLRENAMKLLGIDQL